MGLYEVESCRKEGILIVSRCPQYIYLVFGRDGSEHDFHLDTLISGSKNIDRIKKIKLSQKRHKSKLLCECA